MTFQWDHEFALRILPALAEGFRVTVAATLVASALAIAGGLALAIFRRSRVGWIARPASWIIEFVRSTPLLVQLFVLFYILPDFGIRLGAFTAGVVGLGLHYSSYLSEVYRAGIESVPRGQWEAARALNFTPRRTFWTLIMPQAVRPILPAIGNYIIAMFKETPLLSTITVVELLYVARDDIGSQTFRYIEPMTLVGLLFLAISLPAAGLLRLLERRLGAAHAR